MAVSKYQYLTSLIRTGTNPTDLYTSSLKLFIELLKILNKKSQMAINFYHISFN